MTRTSTLLLGAGLLALTALPAHAADQPVGSVTSQDGKVRVDILSLKRTEGDTVTLRISVNNDSGSNYSIVFGNLRLVDLVGRRIYDAGLTATGCSAPAGGQVACWAMFAAPPANVRTVSVKFYEQLDMIGGVPVTD